MFKTNTWYQVHDAYGNLKYYAFARSSLKEFIETHGIVNQLHVVICESGELIHGILTVPFEVKTGWTTSNSGWHLRPLQDKHRQHLESTPGYLDAMKIFDL
jgi:hypothetical protein